MKNYDVYKRTILFLASCISIVFMCALFAYAWYEYYVETMYVVKFYRRGNYVVIALYGLVMFFFSNMYGGLKIGQHRRVEIMLSQYLSLLLTNMVYYVIISLLAFRFVNPFVLVLLMGAEMVVITIWNIILIRIYNRIFPPWKILLIHGERSTEELINKVETRQDKYVIYDSIDVNEGIDAIREKVKDYQAVIIGDISAVTRNDVLKFCYGQKIRAYVVPKLSDIILMETDRIHIFDTPFLLSRGYALSFDQRFLKRSMDLILSVIITVLASPIMLITALIIKLSDGGPVLYRQVRCTEDNKEFTILKFRSMVVDAEQDGIAKLATVNDTRITSFGRFIRSTRIDELPQLFNILKGDMSFVGPRPERPEIIEQYVQSMPEFEFRTRMKAGLTGYAQIYGKYNTTPYDKLKLDLFYIGNYSLWIDIKLIMMTIKTLFVRQSTQGIEEGNTTAMNNQVLNNQKENSAETGKRQK